MVVTPFSFRLLATDGAARAGVISTPRGEVRTPAFMPVGTAGTVKAMYPAEVRATGADILLGNTYHLMLRPGAERIARLGGLHRFMGWPHPILTDSGGFQVMSLDALRKLDERGVTFKSHVDGSVHELTPERAVDLQAQIGSDIQMQLDECLRLPAEPAEVARAMRLSLRWAERAKRRFSDEAHARKGKTLYGIVQGGDVPELRLESARGLVDLGFEGYGIGGLAVGEPQAVMLAMLDVTAPALPEDRPRYLMGVGAPDDMLEAVARGIDQFDCVMPTRAGRHGQAFTRFGRINLKNARHADDPRPLDPELPVAAAQDWSRGYLHHLVRSDELLAGMMLTAINLTYYAGLMAGARAAILDGRYADYVVDAKSGWARGDIAAL